MYSDCYIFETEQGRFALAEFDGSGFVPLYECDSFSDACALAREQDGE
jgi:hypothetical protein